MTIPKASPHQLMVALDVSTAEDALALAKPLCPLGVSLKVGMELFYQMGFGLVHQLVELMANFPSEATLFLDLKLHDIPNTVEKTAYGLASQGVGLFNVHAGGGEAMMAAAAKGAKAGWEVWQKRVGPKSSLTRPKVIGVTVLTSFSDNSLSETYNTPLESEKTALHLAKLAQKSGLDGVVCSAQEAALIRDACGPEFCLITPGIRPAQYGQSDDQSRVITPGEALAKGATYLVVGRPITQAQDSVVATQQILSEMGVGQEVDRKQTVC